MAVIVDIADRQYDFTDEEKAAEVIADFQIENGLSDEAIITLWAEEPNPRRAILEQLIFDAVDANGSLKRSQTTMRNDGGAAPIMPARGGKAAKRKQPTSRGVHVPAEQVFSPSPAVALERIDMRAKLEAARREYTQCK